jgi:hypothetical protein
VLLPGLVLEAVLLLGMLELLTDPEPLLLVLPLPDMLLPDVMLYFCSSSLTFALTDDTCCLSCSRSALLTVVDDGVATVEDELVLDASGAGLTVVEDAPAELDGAAVFVGGVAGATTLSCRSEQAASAVHTASALAPRRYLRVAIEVSISGNRKSAVTSAIAARRS